MVATSPGRLARFLLACYQWPTFYLALLTLGCVQLVWSVCAFAIRHVVSEERGLRIGRRFVSRLYRYCFRVTGWLRLLKVDASALDVIDPSEAMVIAPNHPSVLDALILISRLEGLSCIMKASVLDNILLGAGARLAGYIRNDGPKTMLRLSTAHLRGGGQLIIFPEGTRTLRAPVNDFKSGFAAMARAAGVPIQTVIIETDTPFMSKGWSILKPPQQMPMHFKARLGERFHVDRDQDVSVFVEDLRAYFTNQLVEAQLGDLWNTTHVASPDETPREAMEETCDASATPLPINASPIGRTAASAPFRDGAGGMRR
jgi:1-acyl-sn-glycerol-3-phosphate acyltransferase